MIYHLLVVCIVPLSLMGMENQIENQNQRTISVLYYPGINPLKERIKLEVGGIVWTLTDRNVSPKFFSDVVDRARYRGRLIYQYFIPVADEQFNKLRSRLLEMEASPDKRKILYTSNSSYNVGNELADIGYSIKPEFLRMTSLSLATCLYMGYTRKSMGLPVVNVKRHGAEGFLNLGFPELFDLLAEFILPFGMAYFLWWFMYALSLEINKKV